MSNNRPLQIVHIASGDLWAGAEAQIFTLAKTLHNRDGIQTRVILLNHGELENRLRSQNIPVEVLPEGEMNSLRIFLRLIKLLKVYKPAIAHTHGIKENILAGGAARIAKICSIRTTHGAQENPAKWTQPLRKLLYTLDWLFARFLQHSTVAVSEELATKLKQDLPDEKVTTIENGIDIEAITAHRKAEERRDNHKFLRIGIAGRLVPVKRVDLFVDAAHHLQLHHPEIEARFYIYGDGPLFRDLQKQVTALGIDEIIHFEGHCDDIHDKLTSLDALLITSDHEGLPMILLEAMALGIPVIAHATGGITSVLGKGKCGYLVHTQNPSEYAEAIATSLTTHIKTTNERTEQAQRRVKRRYSSEVNADKYIGLYQLIAARSGG